MWCQVTITLHKIAAAALEESILYDIRAFRELISCTNPFSIIYFLGFFSSFYRARWLYFFFSFYPVPRPFRELNWPRSRHLAIHVWIFKSQSRSNKTSTKKSCRTFGPIAAYIQSVLLTKWPIGPQDRRFSTRLYTCIPRFPWTCLSLG
jgi:hypothetical protein